MTVNVLCWIIPVGEPLLKRIAEFPVWCVTVSGPSRKIITLDRPTVVMAGCLTLIVTSWNRITVILDRVFIVMASYRTVSMLRQKIITLFRMTDYGQVPDLDCSQLEQSSSNSRQGCHGHG